MKAIAYLVFIFLLLSGGSNKSHATTSSNPNYSKSVNKIAKSRPITITNNNHNSILLQESEIDIEEEFNQTRGFKNNNLKKFEFEKSFFSNHFQLTIISKLNLNQFLNNNCTLCYGLSNPIYITLQVFRI